MTTNALSTYPSFVPLEKSGKFRRQRIAAYVFGAIAIGALVVFVRGCAPGFIHSDEALLASSRYAESDAAGFRGFIVMIAAGIVSLLMYHGSGHDEHVQQFHTAVINEHVAVYDPGSSWRAWSLSWTGGWCGISNSTLFVYSFDRDTIVTISLTEIREVALHQRQIGAESLLVGGAVGAGVMAVGTGAVQTRFITSWVIDVYVHSDMNPHIPLSFGPAENSAKELYGHLKHRGC